MNVTRASNTRSVLVVGAPRSGTTWLGKILDSSPSVLYRHEPDKLLAPAGLKAITDNAAPDAFDPGVSAYLESLIAARFLKSSGKLPLFSKHFRTAPMQAAYFSMIMSLRAAQKATFHAKPLQAMQPPDMVDRRRLDDLTVVLKSVGARGRAGAFAAARPGMRIVLIMRDPFGQVASTLRGIRQRRFERDLNVHECVDTPQAARYGMTRSVFDGLDIVEQLAWHWALLNEKAMDDLAGNPHAMLIQYRDLVQAPSDVSRSILAFCGLPWSDQTGRFLHASTTSSRPDGYYDVFKNSFTTLNRWRLHLPEQDQRRIARTLAGTAAWRLYPELHSQLN